MEGVHQPGDPRAEQPVLTAGDLDQGLIAAGIFADGEAEFPLPCHRVAEGVVLAGQGVDASLDGLPVQVIEAVVHVGADQLEEPAQAGDPDPVAGERLVAGQLGTEGGGRGVD